MTSVSEASFNKRRNRGCNQKKRKVYPGERGYWEKGSRLSASIGAGKEGGKAEKSLGALKTHFLI